MFGIRIIFEEEICHEQIEKFITHNFPKLKCIDSAKGDYVATHIYFGKGDSHNFQWELQIWDKKHVKQNFTSHEKYKQGYTKWESENEEGD